MGSTFLNPAHSFSSSHPSFYSPSSSSWPLSTVQPLTDIPMSPTPLSSSSVHLTLQYISPPSQLDRPLPAHLLSKSLLQRHHFLEISPENAPEYLSWPSNASAKAVDLLELCPPSHDDDPPSYSIQYSSDAEHTYAHVALPPTGHDGEAARLVFQWDADGWKFHDTKLMPFPSNSVASLHEALAATELTANDLSSPLNASSQYNAYGFDDRDDGSDDDDYWNAYGADDDDNVPRERQTVKDSAADSEDAYWARYSSVQGTADSTIPTPPVMRRKQMQPYAEMGMDAETHNPLPLPAHLNTYDTPGEVLPIPNMLHRQLINHNPRWDPASPEALSRLLAEISPRQSPSQNATIVTDFDDNLELSPPLDGSSGDSDTLSPPDVLGLITDSSVEAPHQIAVLDVSVKELRDVNVPMKQSLKGLFTLWKMNTAQLGLSEEEQRQSFLRVVEEAIWE